MRNKIIIKAIVISLLLLLFIMRKANAQSETINGAYVDSLRGINADGTNSNFEQQIRYGRLDSAKAAKLQNNGHGREMKPLPPKRPKVVRDSSRLHPLPPTLSP